MPRPSCSSSSASTRSVRRSTVFDLAILEERPGILIFEATGERAAALFAEEAGGHRWQRFHRDVNRVHTSTVTVAVMSQPTETEVVLRDCDLVFQATRGSGAGGQKRNKTSSCIQLTHLPTGLQIRCESERSQSQNRQSAISLLRSRLWERARSSAEAASAEHRRQQVGSGQRGDKRRTIRMQEDQVTDHVSGRRWRLKEYMKGEW